MYTVNGSTWQVLSTATHASNILATMNANLQTQGLPTLTATTGNALWFFCLAAGAEIASNVDLPLSSAKNSFDMANCDDNQLYTVLPLAGTNLIPASYSSMYVTFTAASTGTLTVPSGTMVAVSGLATTFATTTSIVVPANTSLNVYAIANATGPVVVVSGQANAIVGSLANFGSVNNNAPCLIGSAIESAPQVRQRILKGQTVGNNLNGLILALRSLPGVIGANVYFNPLLTASSLTNASGIFSLPARTAYMVIVGSSANIGSTYWNLMTAPTYGTQQQTVVTLSNQSIPISFDYATPLSVYVQVFVQNSTILSTGYLQALYLAIEAIVPPIGVPLTSEYMLTQLSSYVGATLEGVLLSLTGSNYVVAVNLPSNTYAQFVQACIQVIAQ